MTAQPQTQTPAEDDAYYRAILHDLIDCGAALARHIHERATAATPPLDNNGIADPTIAFERVTRAVRRTIALARHIATQPASHAQAHRAASRARLIRGVEDAIHRKRREVGRLDADALHAELAERLEDPELEFDLQGRPVEHVIEEICRDLGIAMQGRSYVYRRRTPGDIADLRARAAAPPPPAPAFQMIQGGKPSGIPDPKPPNRAPS